MAAFATVDEIRNDAILMLKQVAGTAVQTYADDLLLVQIRNGFNQAFSDAWWPSYMQRFTGTLDGTTGKCTTALPYIRSDDIRTIWKGGTNSALSKPASSLNVTTLTGTAALYYEATDVTDEIIRILPITATGTIDIDGRVHPGYDDVSFTPDITLKIDRMLLTVAACLDHIIDDGDSPGMIEKFQKMYNERFSQLWPDEAHWTTLAGGRQYPNEWWVSP